MTHMFTISDNESETSDDVPEANQSKDNLGDNDITASVAFCGYGLLARATYTRAALDRMRICSDSQASTASQGEDSQFDEGGGDEVPAFRGRSKSAPGGLLAAMHYGRQLRRMSDEFDTILDKAALKNLQKVATARQMRTSYSWFAFWRRRDSDTENNSSGSGGDSGSAE